MSQSEPVKKGTASAFDIRFIIAALIGTYGVVLVLLGIFNNSQAELDRAGGLNINLWAGVGMIVVAAAFAVWGTVKPIVVPDDAND